MKKILLGALGGAALLVAIAGAVVVSGIVNIGADVPHSSLILNLVEFARERSLARHVGDIVPPADMFADERVRRGSGNYEAMCVTCHLSPGSATSELRQGLYPVPPDLTKAVAGGDDKALAARRFWVIKHGIKATGMASWARAGMDDQSIWDMVALLDRLPKLNEEQYRRLVEQSEGHSHGAAEASSAKREPVATKTHDHHKHKHGKSAHAH